VGEEVSASDHLQEHLFSDAEMRSGQVNLTHPGDRRYGLRAKSMDQDAANAKGSRLVFHANEDPVFSPRPDKDVDPGPSDDAGHLWGSGGGHPLGVHVGTKYAAAERTQHVSYMRGESEAHVHPVYLRADTDADFAFPKGEARYDIPYYKSGGGWRYEGGNTVPAEALWNDDAANGGDPRSTKAVRKGKTVAYVNTEEDGGSTSYRAPAGRLQNWNAHVLEHHSEMSLPEVRAAREGLNLSYVAPEHPMPTELPPGFIMERPKERASGKEWPVPEGQVRAIPQGVRDRDESDFLPLRPVFTRTLPAAKPPPKQQHEQQRLL
jgi:hypothetical protein